MMMRDATRVTILRSKIMMLGCMRMPREAYCVWSIREQLEKLTAQASPSTKDAIDAFQKKLTALLGARGGFFAPPSSEITLSRVNGAASTLYQQVWSADAQPTTSQMEALAATEHDSADLLKRWNDFKSSDVPALNSRLRESKAPEIRLEPDPHLEEPQMDEE